MVARSWLGRLVVSLALPLAFLLVAGGARADDWGRYYHWPYSVYGQYYWTPYEYEQIYDSRWGYGYRYPAQMRQLPRREGWRNWLDAKKPYYRGYHFTIDQF